MPDTKIVTCCFCGSRAALVLKGLKTHELACNSCGAPLHDLKMLPKSAAKADHASRALREKRTPDYRKSKPPKPMKKKKKKSLGRKIFSELFDVIEDIID